MQAVVITTPKGGKDWDAERKETDLSKPGNCRWLVSHLKWAVKHNQTVTIAPIL